ncbi:hypothetical protein KCTC52924_03365 [Arenibacter antarcticus]|uniref:SRPBCC family protein n=1 Tax=Arenibacter antarcticus TaxID=2040469 RepID=A0ABW5VEK6_9FLAO|nr:SRPBCC family protein [Arenibacter sp. H213]MCM4166432.1 polyketide cyclase [Arenibacter sp. H213]
MRANKQTITVNTTIHSTIEKVWDLWTKPEHITHWNFASEDSCCPSATNDLRPGGAFVWRMEAKDGSMGFDFTGTYIEIMGKELISYNMTDGRFVSITFLQKGDNVLLTETFEAERTNSEEQQRACWQAILENFKNYVETN